MVGVGFLERGYEAQFKVGLVIGGLCAATMLYVINFKAPLKPIQNEK
jgi:hypothetical protein